MEGLEGVLAAVEYARKKKQEQAAAPAPAPAPAAAPAASQRVAGPAADPALAPAPPPAAAPVPRARTAHSTGPLQAIFEDGNSLLRAIVASEILGPPAALRTDTHQREHTLWNQLPNEPST